MNGGQEILAVFGSCCVALHCSTQELSAAIGTRVHHLVCASPHDCPIVLRVEMREVAPGWIEVSDSTGKREYGLIDRAAHFVRKWMASAFVASHPGLVWLHAAAANRPGAATALLAGPAAAGKSTLLVRLLERSWNLVADDIVGVQPSDRTVLPMPFTPEVRRVQRVTNDDRRAVLECAKDLAWVRPERVAVGPSDIGAIVFPEYTTAGPTGLVPLSVVSATQALAAQSHSPPRDRVQTLRTLFALAHDVSCYRLRYSDAVAAAATVAALIP